jgi:hypothetical protein
LDKIRKRKERNVANAKKRQKALLFLRYGLNVTKDTFAGKNPGFIFLFF